MTSQPEHKRAITDKGQQSAARCPSSGQRGEIAASAQMIPVTEIHAIWVLSLLAVGALLPDHPVDLALVAVLGLGGGHQGGQKQRDAEQQRE